MRRSPIVHVLAVVVSLLSTLGGIALLAYGAADITQWLYSLNPSSPGFPRGILWQLLGVLLLLVAVLTGIFSSAGLLIMWILGLGTLIFVVQPDTLIASLEFVGFLPQWGAESVWLLLPSLVGVSLGAAGIATVLMRRSSRSRKRSGGTIAGHIVGLVLSPILTIGGFILAMSSSQQIRYFYPLPTFEEIAFGHTIRVVIGVILFGLGVCIAKWSPYALILPGLTFAASAIFVVSVPVSTYDAPISAIPYLIHSGLGAATVLLTTTVLLFLVRRQQRPAPKHRR